MVQREPPQEKLGGRTECSVAEPLPLLCKAKHSHTRSSEQRSWLKNNSGRHHYQGLAHFFQMDKLRPREGARSEHRLEAGGVRFILGPMVSSTSAVPTGGWARLGSSQEDSRTKGAEGKAQTRDGGVMGGVG